MSEIVIRHPAISLASWIDDLTVEGLGGHGSSIEIQAAAAVFVVTVASKKISKAWMKSLEL